jgi:hypothetical protein
MSVVREADEVMEEEIVEDSDKEGVMIKGRVGAWSTIEIEVQMFVNSES